MKKLLVMLVAVGLMAGTANAATLWMQFEGGGNEVTLAPSDFINVEIWVDLIDGDTLSSLFYPNWPNDPQELVPYPGGVEGLVQTDNTTSRPNWIGQPVNDVLGLNQQVAFGALNPATDAIAGPGSFLIGIQVIHQNDIYNDISIDFNGSGEFDFYPIMFGGTPGFDQKLITAGGGIYAFDPGYAAYSGYYTYGQGGAAIAGKATGGEYNLPDNPLIVHCIPEPASLALLALGGLAIIRRR